VAAIEDAPVLEAVVEVVAGGEAEVALGALGRARIEGTVLRGPARAAGVRVSARRVFPPRGEPTVRARTDEAGRFAWDELPAGRWRVRVEEGSVERAQDVDLPDGDRAILSIDLSEARIEGRVVTPDRAPVAGADVLAFPLVADGTPEADAVGRATSGADGAFVVAGLPVGDYRVVVASSAFPARALEPVRADLPGGVVPVEVEVGGGASLEVVVRDDGGRAVPDAAVWVDTPEGLALHRTPWLTGPDGVARVDGLAAGYARVRVVARGLGRPPPRAVLLRAGAVDRVEVALSPGGAVRLEVTSGAGPVAGARVEVLRDGAFVERRRSLYPEDEGTAWGVTDANGVLRLEDLAEGAYLLRVRPPRRRARTPDGAPVPAEEAFATVRAGETEPVSVVLDGVAGG
jgi:hypothetical protein